MPDFDALRRSLRGSLVLPGDSDYDMSRQIWNAMIDRRPAAIAYCQGVADVRKVLAFGRTHNLPIAIRGGGHGVAGKSLCDDGIVIDMSRMKGVRVNRGNKHVWAQAGCTLGDVDTEVQEYGLVVPFGVVSLTGIAGLTLGGGMGHFMRSCGLTCDNLVGAEVLTADGEHIKVNKDSHPELFWALRGGGGNFGIVTAFEYQAYEIGPDILAGGVAWDAAEAPAVFKFLNEFMKTAPNELGVVTAFVRASDKPETPESIRGRLILGATLVWNGSLEEGLEAVAPIRELGSSLTDTVGEMTYLALQTRRDGTSPRWQSYWKSGYFADLDDDVIETLCSYAQRATENTIIEVIAMGGKVAEVGETDTAFTTRDARFGYGLFGLWADPENSPANIQWLRDFHGALQEHATGGAYINYVSEDEDERVHTIYHGVYERLAAVKAKYDPQNIFRTNFNIIPSGA